MQKKLASVIFLKDGKAVSGLNHTALFGDGEPVSLAEYYSNRGTDLLLIFDRSEGDEEHDRSLTLIRGMARRADVPMWGAGNIRRAEDVKKILYAGCKKAVLNFAKASNLEMLSEVSARFGRDKLAVCIAAPEIKTLAADPALKEKLSDCASALVVLTKAGQYEEIKRRLGDIRDLLLVPVTWEAAGDQYESALQTLFGLLSDEKTQAAATSATSDTDTNLMQLKADLKAMGADMNTFECPYTWDMLKKGPDGLVPAVVTDYRNEEVLMVAYMNREAFEQTVKTGQMTYWSRSRQELWVKGLTSGHFQYLKELRIDCDDDTLLAKVAQTGAACHTGNRSCFYRTILSRETPARNPMKIFEQVYDVIQDRRIHPKEGSYTNYLFDKGIDKILKKCGEEATEIVIAAKNPNPEEVKYEMADFLYHMMVLMNERGVTWDDIAQELANR